MRPPPPKAKTCPVCGQPLFLVKVPVNAIDGPFKRTTPACKVCKVFVVIHRPRRTDLPLIADASEVA